MQYYFAPMEGLTDSIYRRLHHRYFPGVHRYYTPFFSPTIHHKPTAREQRELPQADSAGFPVVPQVLTKEPADFLWAAELCRGLGYRQINLNLGCPSGTVTAKGKGSGMLRDLDALDRFLDRVCTASSLPVSVKTRLGLEAPEEFPAILAVYNRYPLEELIIHPRVRQQFYKGSLHRSLFAYAMEHSRVKLCFNGEIRSLAQCAALEKAYPGLEAVMIGRGLLADPGMLSGGTDRERLKSFMEELLEAYTAAFGSSRNAMFRLKENWSYLYPRFEGSEKLWKQLRKTTDAAQFRAITREILALPMVPAEH